MITLISIFLLTIVNCYTIQELSDRTDIIDTANKCGMYCDQKKYHEITQSILSSTVLFYSDFSLCDGSEKPEKSIEINSTDLVSNWKEFLNSYSLVRHILTNHIVEFENDNNAKLYAYLTCYRKNSGGEEKGMLTGHYEHHLTKTHNDWRIDEFKFVCEFQIEPWNSFSEKYLSFLQYFDYTGILSSVSGIIILFFSIVLLIVSGIIVIIINKKPKKIDPYLTIQEVI